MNSLTFATDCCLSVQALCDVWTKRRSCVFLVTKVISQRMPLSYCPMFPSFGGNTALTADGITAGHKSTSIFQAMGVYACIVSTFCVVRQHCKEHLQLKTYTYTSAQCINLTQFLIFNASQRQKRHFFCTMLHRFQRMACAK